MGIKRALAALPAAALLFSGAVGAAAAQSLPPHLAAQLNAGTAHTGLGPRGLVGVGISAVQPEVMELGHVEVAGIQIGTVVEGAPTVSTLGEPHLAALLNAGTAYTGIGPSGEVGEGIQGVVPATVATAGDDYLPY
jgi:hypothetical protein